MTVTDHTTPIEGICADIEQLATYFAKKITSKHNQHAIVMIVGSAGKGKSWAAISLAIEVSKKVAELMGGKPEDYFNFEKTFATINKSEVIRVMTKPEKNTILLLDDVAAKAMNARNYKDKGNIDLNTILTTIRPNNNLVIMTTQAGFLIDKVPRSLSHYIIEMEQAYFDYGLTIGKVKQVTFKHNTGQLHFPYLQSGAQKYVRHIFRAPPREITDEYEKMRRYQLEQPEEEKKVDIKLIRQPIVTPEVKKLAEWLIKLGAANQEEIANELNIDKSTFSRGLRKKDTGVVS